MSEDRLRDVVSAMERAVEQWYEYAGERDGRRQQEDTRAAARKAEIEKRAVQKALAEVDLHMPGTLTWEHEPLAVSVTWLLDRIKATICHQLYLACGAVCQYCQGHSDFYEQEPFYVEEYNCWRHATRVDPDVKRAHVCQATSIRNAVAPLEPRQAGG